MLGADALRRPPGGARAGRCHGRRRDGEPGRGSRRGASRPAVGIAHVDRGHDVGRRPRAAHPRDRRSQVAGRRGPPRAPRRRCRDRAAAHACRRTRARRCGDGIRPALARYGRGRAPGLLRGQPRTLPIGATAPGPPHRGCDRGGGGRGARGGDVGDGLRRRRATPEHRRHANEGRRPRLGRSRHHDALVRHRALQAQPWET